jgi:tetratricopeptide (TPR) repeat protein
MKKSFLDLREVRELIRLEKYSEAEKILKELISEHPDDEYVFGAMFDVYLKMGAYEKAEKILNIVLQKEPENYFFLSRKGDLLATKNKHKQALKIFINLYHTKKDSHVGWRLANEYYRLKKIDKAEYYFDQTITKLYDKAELNYLGFLIKKALKVEGTGFGGAIVGGIMAGPKMMMAGGQSIWNLQQQVTSFRTSRAQRKFYNNEDKGS